MITAEEIAHRFAYRPPADQERSDTHAQVRDACRQLAGYLSDLLPDGREQALAFTKLEELMFWANAAVARAE